MDYLTRLPDAPPATPAECQTYWRDVDALRTVQTLIARDLVRARRLAQTGSKDDPGLIENVTDHESALGFIGAKLHIANIQYYEAVDSARHAPPSAAPPPHGHSH